MENANNLVDPLKPEEIVKEKGPITKTSESKVTVAAKEVEMVTPPPVKATGEERKTVKEIVEAEMPELETIEETSEKDDNKRLDKMKKQTLCKLVKKNSLKKHPDEYQELVSDAQYICLKCGRIARDKSSLCKPKLMKSAQKQL